MDTRWGGTQLQSGCCEIHKKTIYDKGKNLKKKNSQSSSNLACLLHRLKCPGTNSSLAHISAPTTVKQSSVLFRSTSRQNVRYLKINHHNFHIFSVALEHISGLGYLVLSYKDKLEVGTYRQAHPLGLIWPGDQLINTTHNKHNRRISMPSVGFKRPIPAINLL